MEDGGAIVATTTRVQNELLPNKKKCKPPRLPRRAAPFGQHFWLAVSELLGYLRYNLDSSCMPGRIPKSTALHYHVASTNLELLRPN